MNYHGGDRFEIDREVLDFSTNINPLGIPNSFRAAFLERMEEFCQYTDLRYRSVKGAAQCYFGVEAERIVPGNGAVDLIYKVARGGKWKKVLIAAPTFSEYERGLKGAGIAVKQIFSYDFDTENLDLTRLKQEVSEGCLVVVCNPNNPTGSVLSRQVLTEFCAYLMEKKVSLMVDEAFLDFLEEEKEYSMVTLTEKFPNLIVIRAATKFFGMPGLRLGYGIFGDRNLIEKIEEISEPWCINTAAVIGAETLFQDREYIEASKKWLRKEGKRFFQDLSSINSVKVFPSRANFFLLRLKNQNTNGAALFEKMLEKGFLIRKSIGFFGLDDSYFRLAVKKEEQNKRIILALKACLEE